jgi:hypothetical protein
MRKRTFNDVFLALAIGGCMALLSPRQDAGAIEQGLAAAADDAVATLMAANPGPASEQCPEPSRRVDIPDPAKIAGEAASGIEMPFFSFGSTHLE